MNRTLYKVVFNKHRNCMMAVAENAKREGKNTADTQATGISPNDIAGFTGFSHSISVISFSLSLLLGSALLLTSPYADAQNIVADKSAPAQQQPTIIQTGNGIPQANIQTPTAAGVSVNQYSHFNVDNHGAVLNNSRRNIQTQLGGWIQGNPWLAGGEARVIVNQVNSANPSLLGGYIEVGGRRAEVVIANPSGIQVDGGGFINASRATLTTGQPQYQAGDLSGFKIRQGNVVIAGHGLDARDTDYTQILSRAVKIDAPVWGKDVRVLAGQNDVSADGSVRSSHSPAANTNSANSLYAIDTGALGGMYAGKITLISTDRYASVRNRGQLFASAGNVAVNAEGKLTNTGTIAATGENHAVSLHARNVHNSGTIASQDAVDIRSRRLDNRNGRLLSANKTQLTVSDDLDNRHGEISAHRQLSVHDKNQNTLAVNNTDGTIESAGDVSLQAGTLANGGTLAAGDKLDIALAGDFTVERDIAAGGRLNLTVKGRLKNPHTLQAADTLTLNAGRIDNQVTGRIMAGRQADITSGHDADNRGIINSNGLTRISVVKTLSNTGTGRIYGNHVALSADKLLNREETAQGGTKAGVIAARERLDIGVRKADNRNGALISSEGRLNIGGSLDGNNEASGRAILLTNTGGKIETGGDAHISAGKLYNLNADFRGEDYIDAQRHLQSFYRNAEALPFFTQDDDGHYRKEDHDLNFDFKDGRHIHIHKYGVEGIWKADYTQTVYKQRIVADRPGEILIGGNLNAQGNWSNQNSRILVGLDLNSDGITNLATLMKVRTVNDGMMRRGSYDRHGFRGSRHIEFDKDAHPVVSPPIRETGFERPVSTVKQHVGNLQPAGKTGMTRPDLSDSLDVKSSTGMVKLPDNSLYTVHPGNKGWLVETDPQFADYRLWLGSDYMLQQLKLDTNHLHKRLGDGYYEQKLVNEQIHRLTGYRRLDGYKSDEEQFKALMDNGLTAAKTFGLTPGIALSAEQVARLTSDIVWMENQTVTLSDGSTQTVLAPKVYALARKGDLNTSGGLISAEQVLLKLRNGNLTNSGTIAGRQAVLIQAQNIHHSGTLQADRISLKAEKSINVEGGQVQAGRLLTIQAQNISLGGTTQTSGDKRNGNTIVDRTAQISVTGAYTRGADNSGSDAILALHADNDINLNAATVSNQVKGGTTQITAGNNLNLCTIRTEHREAYGALDDKNHRHVRQSAEVGSSIRTQNGAMLRAGNNLKIRQGELETEEGKTVLAAGRDVSISEGRQITELDASFHSKSKGLLSRSQTLSRTRLGHDETVGSSIGGGTIAVTAGRDVNVRGSSIISDDGTAIQAGRDISLSAARNRYAGSEYRESKKSGLMGAGGLGFTLGSRKTADDAEHTDLTHTGSTAGSLKGGTAVTAGRRYRQTGSTVSSPEGNNTITAQSIDIEAANNRYAAGYVHTREQKGLTAAINVPVVQAAQNLVQTAQTVGQSKNGRVNAMAAANTAWQGHQAARSILQAAGGQNTGISLSLAYGRQKSRSGQTNRRTEAEAGQIIGKGQTTLTASGGGERSNINITGSDIVGNAATALIADNRITLRSAEQHGSGQDENKSSGWNAGATVRPGSGLGITAGGNAGKGGGQGQSTAHRHTHVGSTAGQTTIRSGGDTTLKGAQLIGKGIGLDAQSLRIRSVQDTETYQSKQQNGNVQVTVGYGFSASGSYSQSKVKADHASVTEQSGIYAGDDGYQIKVGNHTDLKGGIITSSQSAEDEGKNRFQTATLTHSDIQNHSRYEGKSFGIGGSFDLNGGRDGTVTDKQGRPADRISPAIGYGSDSDSKNSTTRSGINTRNIHITDEAGQLARTGRTAEETEARIYTGIDTETAAQHTGRLKNSFDKDAVAKEINLQREVTQEFGKNAAQATAAAADKLGNTRSYERYQAAKTLLEAELQNSDSETEKAAIRATLGQVNAYLAENQSRYDTWKEGGIGRSILHGAAGGLTTGNLGGILAGGGTSLAAPYLDKAAENLGPAGKAAVNALGGAAIGYAAGGNAGTAAVGANVDWNNRQLHPKETQILNKLSKGKSAEEQYRLKAAACALTRCAEGVPDFDPLYKGLKNLQDAGKQFVTEQNVLMRTGAFEYGTWNSLNDIRSSYDRAATKIKGAGNMGLGATTFVGSGAVGGGLCSTGLGCAAGGLIATAGMTSGYTQASEGSRQLFGTYQSDFGKKVVLSLGTPIEYESPLVSDAKNLAIWGLETLITRKLGKITNPSTPKNPRIKQINDLSQKVSFKSSVLINNQKVELTQQQVLSNGKILPVGTIAKLDKNGVVATFPDGKTVTYAGVTEQKALPKPDKSAPKIRPNGIVELFTDSKGVQIHGAVGVSPSDPMAVARDARFMPNIPTGSQARVIANNPYIPKPEGKFTIMDYLPEAARITKKGGEIVINGTVTNKYLRGIPNEAELTRMGLRLKYNGPLKEEFKQLKFHLSDGQNLKSDNLKTIVFEKVK